MPTHGAHQLETKVTGGVRAVSQMIELASNLCGSTRLRAACQRRAVDAGALAATRNRSIRRRSDAIWFQLANVRVSSVQLGNCRNRAFCRFRNDRTITKIGSSVVLQQLVQPRQRLASVQLFERVNRQHTR
jgi:hypothetical protein